MQWLYDHNRACACLFHHWFDGHDMYTFKTEHLDLQKRWRSCWQDQWRLDSPRWVGYSFFLFLSWLKFGRLFVTIYTVMYLCVLAQHMDLCLGLEMRADLASKWYLFCCLRWIAHWLVWSLSMVGDDTLPFQLDVWTCNHLVSIPWLNVGFYVG